MKKLLIVAFLVTFIAAAAQSFKAEVARAQAPPARTVVTPLPSFAEPGISPDGATIAFVSGGDIWEVPARGGDARLLVSHPATESRPLFSPDGRRLAFTSTRTGGGDVYVLTLATGELTRLTFDDANELVSGWAPDSKAIYFQSTSHEISGLLDVYRVGAEGGTPMQVAGDRYTTEYFAAPSSSGAMAITARANAASQWWRKGHSHLDESEIWIVGNTAYQAVTNGGAKDAWPMWDGDGRTLYFMSDRSGAQNIWAVAGAAQGFGAARAITNFKDGRVLWPSITKDGKTIAFERDFGIWTVDRTGGQPREVAIALRGAPAATAVEHRTFSDQIQELALSPDGRKIAFTVHGEIFSSSAKDGGDAARVTNTAGDDAEIVWAPDSRRLAYMSDRDGTNHLFLYDFATGKETQLTSGRGRDDMPRFSPDGRWLAFERDSRELRVIDLGAPAAPPGDKAERLVATGVFDTPPFFDARDIAWSPDSRFIAYVSAGAKAFANVHVAAVTPGASPSTALGTGPSTALGTGPSTALGTGPSTALGTGPSTALGTGPSTTLGTGPSTALGTGPSTALGTGPALKAGEGRAISFLANTNAGSLSWSPDGTYLTLATAQRTEPGDVIRIDLLPRTPKFREDQFRDLFKEDQPKTTPEPSMPVASPPAPPAIPASPAPGIGRAKPVDIVFDDIRRRASSLPTGIDVTRQEISPDGKWLLLTASAAGQQNLYVFSIDELSREPAVARQLTSTPGQKRSAHFTADSKEVYYLDRGRVFNVTLERREPKPVAVTAELDVDFSREKVEAFHQAWTYLRDQFFDEKMNGVDWNAVRATYEPRVAGSRTPDEMRRVISLMLGELNASHMGISAPPQGGQTTLGRLAIDFDRAEYDASGRLKIASVVALGPAAIAGIKAGDVIESVDGKAIAPRQNVDELLDHTIGKRIAVGISSSATATPGRGAGAPGVENVVVLKPIDQQTEKGLRYREWVEQKRAYVAKASGGRLGYVHMFDMSANSLSQLHVDLDAENHSREGVVVDVRTNNGGFVNVYAIDVFARRGYFNMLSRGFPSVSSRTALGQRALELPTILVTNQHSLSDAEDFTEGYRTLKLGKVVGEPTAGWIIYTGGVTLVDGSVLRMPGTKIFASDGTPMEMHPRPVDIPVKRPVGESYSGKDSQLDAAVAELLKQIGTRAKSTAGVP